MDLHGRLAQNNKTSGSGTYGIPEVVHGEDSTRVGKFFEKEILNAVNLTRVNSAYQSVNAEVGLMSDTD